jgi:hypothetical protein
MALQGVEPVVAGGKVGGFQYADHLFFSLQTFVRMDEFKMRGIRTVVF